MHAPSPWHLVIEHNLRPQAVGYVRERRPIVDPIGSFPDLLKRLEKALREKKA